VQPNNLTTNQRYTIYKDTTALMNSSKKEAIHDLNNRSKKAGTCDYKSKLRMVVVIANARR
jgi:hypothetical protein